MWDFNKVGITEKQIKKLCEPRVNVGVKVVVVRQASAEKKYIGGTWKKSSSAISLGERSNRIEELGLQSECVNAHQRQISDFCGDEPIAKHPRLHLRYKYRRKIDSAEFIWYTHTHTHSLSRLSVKHLTKHINVVLHVNLTGDLVNYVSHFGISMPCYLSGFFSIAYHIFSADWEERKIAQ